MSLERFRNNSNVMNYKGHRASVIDNNLYIDSELVYEGCGDISSAYAYSRSYIDNLVIIENSTVNKDNIASLISKHHDVKITNRLIEAYAELISSEQFDEFTLDPVLLEIKSESSSFSNKIEFTLRDGENVAISEETISQLSSLDVDKYRLVSFMNESKDNFMAVIQELRENHG